MNRLPPLPRVVYTGSIWAGVQVVDRFMREMTEDAAFGEGYDGYYNGAVDLELQEFSDMECIPTSWNAQSNHDEEVG